MRAALGGRDSVGWMGPRSLTAEENARVVAAVRELLRRGETQVSLARVLGVKQSAISGLLSGRHRAGYGFARAVAQVAGVALDALLSGGHGGESVQGVAPQAESWAGTEGWAEALGVARSMFPAVSAEAWAWLGAQCGPRLPSLSPVALGLVASAYDQARPVTPAVVSGVRARR